MWGCLWQALGVFLAMAIAAIVLDGIEWLLYHWWIFLIIFVVWMAIRAYRRPALLNKWFGRRNPNGTIDPVIHRGVGFKKLIKAAALDGVITEKERQAIIRKGVERGMSADEAEIMMEAYIHKHNLKVQKSRTTKAKSKKAQAEE